MDLRVLGRVPRLPACALPPIFSDLGYAPSMAAALNYVPARHRWMDVLSRGKLGRCDYLTVSHVPVLCSRAASNRSWSAALHAADRCCCGPLRTQLLRIAS